MISLDLVIDATWGDIGKEDTQIFWLNAIRSGYIIGMLSGPPCCTWSVARGKQHDSLGPHTRAAPRVLRTAEELWGMTSIGLPARVLAVA